MLRRSMLLLFALSLGGFDVWLAAAPAPAHGQCAGEVNAVMLLSGIRPYEIPQVTLLHVSRVATPTNPTADDLMAAVAAAYAGDPHFGTYDHRRVATIGHYDLYLAEPGDFGAATIVDNRTAEVLFAGTIVWMGTGQLVVPASATHDSPPVSGVPAGSPVSITAFPCEYCSIAWGTAQSLAIITTLFAAQTDFLRSMAACGDYSVVAYTWTPAVGATDPVSAVQVLIFSGSPGADWIPVAAEEHSWSEVKALYR